MPALPLQYGRLQFLDANGDPLVGGMVYTYVPGTTRAKTSWQDVEQTILNTNPIILDDLGSAAIFGTGIYRFLVNDALGDLVWDAVTSTALGLYATIDFSTLDPEEVRTAISVYSIDDVNVRIAQIYTDLEDKADLVDGKVPAAQLPPAAADALKATSNLSDVVNPLTATGNLSVNPLVTGSQNAPLIQIVTEWVSPHTFNIDFNGANSAAGLQALFTAAAGKSLRLPPGLFSTDTQINLVLGKPYDIQGAQGNVYGNAISGGAVLRNTNTAGGHLLVYDDTALAYPDEFHSVIEGITFFGNALSGDNLRLIGAHHLTLRKVWSTTAGGSAVNFVQDCWSNTMDDVTGVQSGEWGWKFGKRTNSFTIIAGQAIANARKTHGGDTFGNVGLFGVAGQESRHIAFVGEPDISYAGENPFGGATVTRAYNFYAEHTYGLNGSLYSEDGIGDGSGNSIVIGATNKLVNLAMIYLQNRNMSVSAENVRAMVHVLAQTRNVNASFASVTGECDIMSTLETAGGFTASVTKQNDTTYTPTVVSGGGGGTVSATSPVISYRRRNGYIDFYASIPITTSTGTNNSVFITLPTPVKSGNIIFCSGQNQSSGDTFFVVLNNTGATTVEYPITGTPQTLAFSGRYEEA